MRFNNIDIRSKYDSELTATMRTESSHIIDMYLRLLKYYDNDNCKKLNISCNEKAGQVYISSSRNGYISLQMPFCRNDFLSLSPKEKSMFYLNLISQSIDFIGNQWGWNLQYFDSIRRKIISSNFKNQWMYGRPSESPVQNKSAYLRIVQTIDAANIFLVITQDKRVVKKILIVKTEPTFWIYRQYLGKIQWRNSGCLEIINKEKQIIFEISDV